MDQVVSFIYREKLKVKLLPMFSNPKNLFEIKPITWQAKSYDL